LDRLPVGLVGVDRDHLDRPPVLFWQRAQVALDPAPAAAVEHLDHPLAVEVGDDRGKLAAAAVVGLIERQPPRRPRLAARGELVLRARSEGAGDLVARRALTARHLGMGGAAAHPLEQAPAEAPRHALARRQLGMGLGERPPAAPAAVAALAPHQIRHSAGDRQVAHPHHRAVLDVNRRTPAIGAATRARDQLDLEVEPVAPLHHPLHLEALQADEAANVIPHPLFPLAPQFMTTRSLEGAADVSLPSPSTPPFQQDPHFQTEWVGQFCAVTDSTRGGQRRNVCPNLCTNVLCIGKGPGTCEARRPRAFTGTLTCYGHQVWRKLQHKAWGQLIRLAEGLLGGKRLFSFKLRKFRAGLAHERGINQCSALRWVRPGTTFVPGHLCKEARCPPRPTAFER
jgi:hypothetical protein